MGSNQTSKKRDIDRNECKRENGLRINHDYQVGDKVLITINGIDRKLNCPTKCPFPIVQTYTNSTVCVQNGAGTGICGKLVIFSSSQNYETKFK